MSKLLCWNKKEFKAKFLLDWTTESEAEQRKEAKLQEATADAHAGSAQEEKPAPDPSSA